jgi:hypothetical protein
MIPNALHVVSQITVSHRLIETTQRKVIWVEPGQEQAVLDKILKKLGV